MNFEENFKSYTVVELLEVIENTKGRQPIEIYLAKKELDSRHLSAEEMLQAKAERENARHASGAEPGAEEKPLETESRKKLFIKKIKEAVKACLAFVNPLNRSKSLPGKIMTAIFLLLAALCILPLLVISQSVSPIRLVFPHAFLLFFLFILYFVPLGFMLVAILLFFNGRRGGWILLSIISTLNIILFGSFLPAIIAAGASLWGIAEVLFNVAILVLLCLKPIREIYRIKDEALYGIFIILLIFISLFLFGNFIF